MQQTRMHALFCSALLGLGVRWRNGSGERCELFNKFKHACQESYNDWYVGNISTFSFILIQG
jgi:hypothetical protein